MGVRISALMISAFIAGIAAVVLIGVGVYARRHGHLRSRASLIAMSVVIALLIAYAWGAPFLV
jgi:uncharacterized YccA/Bax inhibitor family protein